MQRALGSRRAVVKLLRNAVQMEDCGLAAFDGVDQPAAPLADAAAGIEQLVSCNDCICWFDRHTCPTAP